MTCGDLVVANAACSFFSSATRTCNPGSVVSTPARTSTEDKKICPRGGPGSCPSPSLPDAQPLCAISPGAQGRMHRPRRRASSERGHLVLPSLRPPLSPQPTARVQFAPLRPAFAWDRILITLSRCDQRAFHWFRAQRWREGGFLAPSRGGGATGGAVTLTTTREFRRPSSRRGRTGPRHPCWGSAARRRG